MNESPKVPADAQPVIKEKQAKDLPQALTGTSPTLDSWSCFMVTRSTALSSLEGATRPRRH